MNPIATKLILDFIHSGLKELSTRTDNKIDDYVVDLIGNILHPSSVFGNASTSDGIEEEKEAKKSLWKNDDEAFRK